MFHQKHVLSLLKNEFKKHRVAHQSHFIYWLYWLILEHADTYIDTAMKYNLNIP